MNLTIQAAWQSAGQRLQHIVCVFLFSVLIQSSARAVCESWGEAKQIGTLDTTLIPEASGLAYSDEIGPRLYHLNDSGNPTAFYVTDLSGSNTQVVRVRGYEQEDFEAMGLGPCGSKRCLYLADIGDNRPPPGEEEKYEDRPYISIVLVSEQENFEAAVRPERVLKLVYPDGPKDAEGLAIHPNGDLYILSKEYNYNVGVLPHHIYKLPEHQWQNTHPNQPMVLTKMAELDLSIILPNEELLGLLTTGLDISPLGTAFSILTYTKAVVFDFNLADLVKVDLSLHQMKRDRDYSIVDLAIQSQQEAITFAGIDRELIYTSEMDENDQASIMQVSCQNASTPASKSDLSLGE